MLPFHLCQPGGSVSCGACCGLYNFKDHSRGAVTEALTRHTNALAQTSKTPDAFSAKARELKAQEKAPAFKDVRVCPLLGFLDGPKATRVGCLAHPLQNAGVDLRDCGVYDAKTCESFECPSFIWLSIAEAHWIRAACPDWYVYGLVITDVDFVRGVTRLVEAELGEKLKPEAILARPLAIRASSRLFALKEHLRPGTEGQNDVFGQFGPSPDGVGEPVIRTINYAELGLNPAPEDSVVLCLGLAPISKAALESARLVVHSGVEALVQALRANEQTALSN